MSSGALKYRGPLAGLTPEVRRRLMDRSGASEFIYCSRLIPGPAAHHVPNAEEIARRCSTGQGCTNDLSRPRRDRFRGLGSS